MRNNLLTEANNLKAIIDLKTDLMSKRPEKTEACLTAINDAQARLAVVEAELRRLENGN